MRHLDITLESPAENLALDEALLLEAEEGRTGEILRTWSSHLPFVVLGVGGRVNQEVFPEACEHFPILRRCSGGGTVLQGPGCLNYALVMRVSSDGPLSTIHGTNHFVMERNAYALSTTLHHPVTIQGHTDLVVADRKVSGNAQRRLRHHLLFHGTFLLDLNFEQVSHLLRPPPRQPEYRANRPHEQFMTNLHLDPAKVKLALCQAWGVSPSVTLTPRFFELEYPSLRQRMERLVLTRYGLSEWNLHL